MVRDMSKTAAQIRAQWTKLNSARRAARQAATDFAFNNKPLSPAQTEEWRALVAKADAAQDACDRFYVANAASVGGDLRC